MIYINPDKTEGTFNSGGQVEALDMTWYARYKPDVDRIMSGFLWLGFSRLLFKRVPAIIRGAEMVSAYSTDIRNYNAIEIYRADHDWGSIGRPIR